MGMSAHQIEFADRIARIEAGSAASRFTLYVGVDESYVIGRRETKRAQGLGELARNAAYPLSMIAALLLGMISYAAGRLLQFRLNGMPDPTINPNTVMVSEAVIGFAIAVVTGFLLHLRGKELTSVKSAGVVMGSLFFHNVVHAFPQLFEMAFSPMWVSRVLTTTEAGSLLWRGISFTF